MVAAIWFLLSIDFPYVGTGWLVFDILHPPRILTPFLTPQKGVFNTTKGIIKHQAQTPIFWFWTPPFSHICFFPAPLFHFPAPTVHRPPQSPRFKPATGWPMYIHTFTYTYVCTYVRMQVCTYLRTYACMYVRTYVCMKRTYVRTYVRNVCMYEL